MKIQIIIKKSEISLQLLDGVKLIDTSFWSEEHNLSQTLLFEINKLLKKNNLSKFDVKNIEVRSEIKESFTSVRIAEIVAKTWKIAGKI